MVVNRAASSEDSDHRVPPEAGPLVDGPVQGVASPRILKHVRHYISSLWCNCSEPVDACQDPYVGSARAMDRSRSLTAGCPTGYDTMKPPLPYMGECIDFLTMNVFQIWRDSESTAQGAHAPATSAKGHLVAANTRTRRWASRRNSSVDFRGFGGRMGKIQGTHWS